MAVYFAPIAPGLGDLIVCLPVIQSLIDSGEETILVIRSPFQETIPQRIPGLSGVIREPEFRRMKLRPEDRYINMRDHPLQSGSLWGSPEFEKEHPGYTILDVINQIAKDRGVPALSRSRRPLLFSRREESKDRILFIPGTSGDVKAWPTARWLELNDLALAEGLSCAMIGQPHKSRTVQELMEQGLRWIEDANIGEAVDLVSSCAAVVSVDTGLMHIAVHQGIPTVALFRSNFFYRKDPDCFPVFANACSAECVKKEFESGHHEVIDYDNWTEESSLKYWKSWHCQTPDDNCMTGMSADRVLSILKTALESRAKNR